MRSSISDLGNTPCGWRGEKDFAPFFELFFQRKEGDRARTLFLFRKKRFWFEADRNDWRRGPRVNILLVSRPDAG